MAKPTKDMPKSSETLVMPIKSASETQNGTPEHIHLRSILNDKYQIIRELNENTGEAAIYVCQAGNQEFVAKVYHRGKRLKEEIRCVIQEIESPLVNKALESFEQSGRYIDILPYFRNGDLEQAAPLEENFVANVVVPNINTALQALHSKGIIHRDVKPNNILFSEDKQSAVLGDFGISSVLGMGGGSTKVTQTGSKTFGYSAPETYHNVVSTKSDYYSLGISLLHLLTGRDPFAGMTEVQILDITVSGKIVIPDTLSARMVNIIQGLTLKEREDRWGYEEVSKWCNGEYIKIKTSHEDSRKTKIPYIFEGGQEIFELEELSQAFINNWRKATKHLYRGLISQHLKNNNWHDLALKAMDCEEERNHDLGLFKLIYFINPNAPLCWRGENFFDLSGLGRSINKHLPDIDRGCLDILECGALQFYLKMNEFDPELISEIINLEKIAKNSEETAYYRLHFDINQTDEFCFESVSIYSVKELIDYLYGQIDRLDEISKSLNSDEYFFSWLEHLGLEQPLENWKKLYGK